jgi:hypothetical protein
MIISAAQVWYISKVYPERVTKQEAEDCIEWQNMSEDNKSYWIIAAKILQKFSLFIYRSL